jgi:hypothetical protein
VLGWIVVEERHDQPRVRLVYRGFNSRRPHRVDARDSGVRVIWIDETGQGEREADRVTMGDHLTDAFPGRRRPRLPCSVEPASSDSIGLVQAVTTSGWPGCDAIFVSRVQLG